MDGDYGKIWQLVCGRQGGGFFKQSSKMKKHYVLYLYMGKILLLKHGAKMSTMGDSGCNVHTAGLYGFNMGQFVSSISKYRTWVFI
jgi:hypothetical protein